MALVAVSMVAIIAMAALSIDIGTLYEAKAEAQRAADAAALTAARMISISGITGDPGNATGSWPPICGGASGLATLAAINVAQQNLIGGVSVPTASITVTYGAGTTGGSNPSCVGVTNFGVNPIVTVNVQRTNLPIFFARVFSLVGGRSSAASVSATASAEVFNPSASGNVASAGIIPVNPRCVKPWIIPNVDPNGGGPFVNLPDGSIAKPGVLLLGAGVIGESFKLTADCTPSGTPGCKILGTNMIANPPQTGAPAGTARYVPAFVSTSPGAVPSCSAANNFSKAIVGCDQSTVYACGTPLGGQADLTENPVNPTGAGDTFTSVQCLIGSSTGGEDTLNASGFPFQIEAGFANPLVQKNVVNNDDLITASNSIATLPIYDGTALNLAMNQPPVTIVGFLQVFINVPGVATDGSMPTVTVLNVAGCSNTATNPAVAGTSPVPIRLITPP